MDCRWCAKHVRAAGGGAPGPGLSIHHVEGHKNDASEVGPKMWMTRRASVLAPAKGALRRVYTRSGILRRCRTAARSNGSDPRKLICGLFPRMFSISWGMGYWAPSTATSIPQRSRSGALAEAGSWRSWTTRMAAPTAPCIRSGCAPASMSCMRSRRRAGTVSRPTPVTRRSFGLVSGGRKTWTQQLQGKSSNDGGSSGDRAE